MKKANILTWFVLALCLEGYSQNNNVKTFNTLSFFYIDNSEGYTTDVLNASINNEVAEEFKKKLSAIADKPDNYFFLIASDGENVKEFTNAHSVLESDWLKKYLNRPSREAAYSFEKQLIRDNFTNYPIKVKKEVDIHIFLSAYAVNQLSKKVDELPTPVLFYNELPLYLNNNQVTTNVYVYTNKDTLLKLGAGVIKGYFTFCYRELNLSGSDIEIIAF